MHPALVTAAAAARRQDQFAQAARARRARQARRARRAAARPGPSAAHRAQPGPGLVARQA